MAEEYGPEAVVVRPLIRLAEDIEESYMARLIGMLICRGQTLGVILPDESKAVDKALEQESWTELASQLRVLAEVARKRRG